MVFSNFMTPFDMLSNLTRHPYPWRFKVHVLVAWSILEDVCHYQAVSRNSLWLILRYAGHLLDVYVYFFLVFGNLGRVILLSYVCFYLDKHVSIEFLFISVLYIH